MVSAVFQIHCALTPQCEHRGSYHVPVFVCVCVHVHVRQPGPQHHVSQLLHELKVKKMLLLQLGSSSHKSPLGILVWGEGRMTP